MIACSRCGCPLTQGRRICPFCCSTCRLPSRREVRRMLECGLPLLLSPEPLSLRPAARSREGLLIVVLFIVLLVPIMAVAATFHPRASLPQQVALEDRSWPHWGALPFTP